jgi:hypothetical protein
MGLSLLTVLAMPASLARAAGSGIVISEIHYHAGSDLDTDDFLELTNTSTAPVDVRLDPHRRHHRDPARRLRRRRGDRRYARAQLTGLAPRADSEVTFSYRWRDPAA